MRQVMSPVVARMVAEHGLDIGEIPGTGRGGRVTKRDVEAYLGQDAQRARRPPRPRPRRRRRPHRPPPPRRPSAAPAAPAPRAAETPLVPSGPLEEIYRFSTIRKVIAKHMRSRCRSTRTSRRSSRST